MPTSQNGYPANDRNFIATYTVPGTEVKIPMRKGDVSFILLYVAEQFHKRVEALVPGWNWGYAERTVVGGTSLSNHASGTAIDLNAPRHPLGRRNTFSATQVAQIRKILAEVGGVVRWGGDYVSRADDMHFEIIAGTAAVAAAASRLRIVTVGAPVRPVPSSSRSLKNLRLTVDGKLGTLTIQKLQWMIGNRHRNGQLGRDTVRQLERYLGNTVDGTLGRDTVRSLQRKVGLSERYVDGILGPQTIKALQVWLNQ